MDRFHDAPPARECGWEKPSLRSASSRSAVLRRKTETAWQKAFALYPVGWSPDAKSLVALQDWDGNAELKGKPVQPDKPPLVRVDLRTGDILSLGVHGRPIDTVSDGRFIYFNAQERLPGEDRGTQHISRIPIGGGAAEIVWTGKDLGGFCVRPEGRYIYSVRNPPKTAQSPNSDTPDRYTIVRLDQESRQETSLAELPFSPQRLFVSPDGRSLYFLQESDSTRRAVLIKNVF